MEYFNEREFRSPDTPTTPVELDELFLVLLNRARSIYGRPIRINSGYRTPSHNKAVGGATRSSHLVQPVLAADLQIQSGLERKQLLQALLQAESEIQKEYPAFYTRIGFGYTFIHVDCDSSKSETSFTY